MVGISTMVDNNLDSISIASIATQMENFQRSDEARQALLTSILEKYSVLMKDHTNLKDDYTSEKEIRRKYQNEANRLQIQGNQTQLSLESSYFVLALIDGDGVIFQDSLLASGANGGSEAASKLQQSIREHVMSVCGGNSRNWPIMVQVYVSLDKLAQKLSHIGLLKNPQEFRAFAQSFGVNQPLFSIIDVGQGKERADHRIKEMLRTFSDNPTCRHIIFGGCHDGGYLLNLDQYKHNPERAAHITLLESTPPARGFAELPNFPRTSFGAVFKNEPLPDFVPTTHAQPTLPVRTMTNQSLPPEESPTKSFATPTFTATATSPSTTHSSLAGISTDSNESSWATVGKIGSSNGTISIAPKQNPKKRFIYYNKHGQRLDEQLPPRDRLAAEAIEKRMDKAGRNLCNHWHLNKGKCTNGSFCKFQHEPKLSPAELNALRYKTRSLACKNRDCTKFDCYLGHQCTFERDQGKCPFPDSCNLRVAHGMDRTKYERWDEDENVEYSK